MILTSMSASLVRILKIRGRLAAPSGFTSAGNGLVLEKSAIVFIPAGLTHCPYCVENVRKPILHFSGAPSGKYELLDPSMARTWVVEDSESLVSTMVRLCLCPARKHRTPS